MATLTHPTVHINGTDRQSLVDGYSGAYSALRVAVEALQVSAPNARDYYVQGPEAFRKARTEHEARMHKLADVASELVAIIEVLDGGTL